MYGENSDQLVDLLVRAIQAYCSSHVQFASCVEVVGHIHLNIDRRVKVDYVVSEEVVKAVTGSCPLFSSHSYLSHPPAQEVSGCREAQRRSSSHHSHSPHSSAEDSVVTVQQAHSVDPACVNAPSSQALPADHGGNSLASVSVRGSGEDIHASDQMRVTVSFDPAGVLPLIKQESTLSAEGASPGGNQPGVEHHGSVSNLVNCPEASGPLLLSFRQEDSQPAIPHSPTASQPPVSSTDSFPPQVRNNSQTSQSAGAATNTVSQPPMIQIQEVHSEASGTVVTCSPQSVPPAVLSTRQLQESYSSTRPQENPLQPQPSALTNHSSPTGGAYLDGSGPHQVDHNRGSVSSGQRDVSSAGEPQCPAVSVNCQSEAGSSLNFGNLCLDVVTVKEEVMEEEEEPPSPQDPYTVESAGQDQELSAFSNMLLESLAAPGDGTQLILVQESLQQRNLSLPFPVMLHTHASLSPSLNSPHLEDSSAQGSATDMEVPSSSAITSPTMSLTLDGEEGVQPPKPKAGRRQRKSNAQKCAEYRARLKENPERFENFVRARRECSLRWRHSQNEEQKTRSRELSRRRQQKRRLLRKAMKKEAKDKGYERSTKPAKPAKKVALGEEEEKRKIQREKARDRQRKRRANMSEARKQLEQIKRKEKYWDQKRKKELQRCMDFHAVEVKKEHDTEPLY